MPEPIDLDLVELRCKLRGWTYVRFVEDGIDCVSVECKYGGELVLGASGVFDTISPWGTPAHKRIETILTAPRWTLERLLSEPPEGWMVVDHVTPRRRYWQALLAWGESYSEHNHELSCALGAHPQSLLSVTVNQTCASHADLARLAERHKAAAELALILAEVEP